MFSGLKEASAPVPAMPWWRKLINSIGSLVALLSSIGALLGLMPSVYAYLATVSVGTPALAYDGHPYSVTFELKNTGLFEIRDITWSCEILQVHLEADSSAT